MTCTCSSPTAAGRPDRRRTMLEVGGKVHALNCWAARTAKLAGTIAKRLFDGLPAEVAVRKPVKPRPPYRRAPAKVQRPTP
jgi:hypothetical protein